MIKTKSHHILICFSFIFIAIIAAVNIICDFDKPVYYSLLFMLPVTFAVLSAFCNNLYTLIPDNLGVSLIIVLFFCRMVVSPLFMCLGDYLSTIKINVDQNTPWAVLLVCYEETAVFIYLLYRMQKPKQYTVSDNDKFSIDSSVQRKYGLLICVILILILGCIIITPQLMDMYRTVFEISDENFTNYEDSYIIRKYGTGFVSTLTLVAGNYLIRAALIIVPAFFIVLLAKKKEKKFNRIISFFLCFVSLFFIGGAIARSIIYIISLLMLRVHMFPGKKNNSNIMRIIIVGVAVALGWWIYNFDSSNLSLSRYAYFSGKFSAYFSSVNIVSGVFNLPDGLEYKLRYIIYDFLKSIPFCSTIFGLNHVDVQTFFNAYNDSWGQIPPTIGMGCYYFGPVLAPVYSLVFAHIAYSCGEKIAYAKNPFSRIRLILTTIFFSMGIVMYNIPITFINLFTMLLPMYIMEKIVYNKTDNREVQR